MLFLDDLPSGTHLKTSRRTKSGLKTKPDAHRDKLNYQQQSLPSTRQTTLTRAEPHLPIVQTGGSQAGPPPAPTPTHERPEKHMDTNGEIGFNVKPYISQHKYVSSASWGIDDIITTRYIQTRQCILQNMKVTYIWEGALSILSCFGRWLYPKYYLFFWVKSSWK